MLIDGAIWTLLLWFVALFVRKIVFDDKGVPKKFAYVLTGFVFIISIGALTLLKFLRYELVSGITGTTVLPTTYLDIVGASICSWLFYVFVTESVSNKLARTSANDSASFKYLKCKIKDVRRTFHVNYRETSNPETILCFIKKNHPISKFILNSIYKLENVELRKNDETKYQGIIKSISEGHGNHKKFVAFSLKLIESKNNVQSFNDSAGAAILKQNKAVAFILCIIFISISVPMIIYPFTQPNTNAIIKEVAYAQNGVLYKPRISEMEVKLYSDAGSKLAIQFKYILSVSLVIALFSVVILVLVMGRSKQSDDAPISS